MRILCFIALLWGATAMANPFSAFAGDYRPIGKPKITGNSPGQCYWSNFKDRLVGFQIVLDQDISLKGGSKVHLHIKTDDTFTPERACSLDVDLVKN